MKFNAGDYVRTTTKPYVYARVTNPDYCREPNGIYVECEQMLKKDVIANKWYKADGTFHENESNLMKINRKELATKSS